jgi:hypothetical protein
MSRFVVTTTCLIVVAVIASIAPAAVNAATPEHTDVMLVFDTSGSMAEELGEAKQEIEQVMAHVSSTLPDVEFGVAEVRDYSPSPYTSEIEEPGVKPWQLDQPLTANVTAVKNAIAPLEAFGGGDGPEAYGRALWETDSNPNVGWRADARHVIILVADNVPHDNNLDEGIPESKWAAEGTPAPWNTGEELPGTWNIPSTIWTPGTDLAFQTIMRQLASDGKALGMVDFKGNETGYLPYWEYWAGLSGGEALLGGTGELASKVTTLIESRANATLPPCPTGEVRNGEEKCVTAPAVSVPAASPCALTVPLSTTPVTLSVIGGQQFGVTLTTASGASAVPSSLKATIEWGDGSPPETAAITGSPGDLAVKGIHTYPVPSSRREYRVISRIYYAPAGCPTPSTPAATINAPAYVVPPAVSHSGWKPFLVGSAIFGTVVGGVACGVGVVGEVPTSGFDTGLTYLGCAATVTGAVGIIPAIKDPPDPHFQSVFRPTAFPVPQVPRKCRGLSGSSCSRLRTAERRYFKATAVVASLSEAVGVTANRFGGAVAANNVPAEELQRRAEAKDLPMQASAIKRKRVFGRLLAREVKRDHLNVVFSARQVARGRAALERLHSVPKWLIIRLEHNGIITSPAELQSDIATYLKEAPKAKRTTLTAVLGM